MELRAFNAFNISMTGGRVDVDVDVEVEVVLFELGLVVEFDDVEFINDLRSMRRAVPRLDCPLFSCLTNSVKNNGFMLLRFVDPETENKFSCESPHTNLENKLFFLIFSTISKRILIFEAFKRRSDLTQG